MKISAIVVTKNEAKNIGRCLASLASVADEIVVVDAYSQDATSQICESFTNVHFISCPWIGLAGMKHLGRQVAQYDHILNIAADEVLSPELQQNLWLIKQNAHTEIIAMVNYTDKPRVNVDAHFDYTRESEAAPHLIVKSAFEHYTFNKKNAPRKRPKIEELW